MGPAADVMGHGPMEHLDITTQGIRAVKKKVSKKREGTHEISKLEHTKFIDGAHTNFHLEYKIII